MAKSKVDLLSWFWCAPSSRWRTGLTVSTTRGSWNYFIDTDNNWYKVINGGTVNGVEYADADALGLALVKEEVEWSDTSAYLQKCDDLVAAIQNGDVLVRSQEQSGSGTFMVNAYGENGTVSGGGAGYNEGDLITIEATPAEGYYFTGWSDGCPNPVRSIIVTKNLDLTANFESDEAQ